MESEETIRVAHGQWAEPQPVGSQPPRQRSSAPPTRARADFGACGRQTPVQPMAAVRPAAATTTTQTIPMQERPVGCAAIGRHAHERPAWNVRITTCRSDNLYILGDEQAKTHDAVGEWELIEWNAFARPGQGPSIAPSSSDRQERDIERPHDLQLARRRRSHIAVVPCQSSTRLLIRDHGRSAECWRAGQLAG